MDCQVGRVFQCAQTSSERAGCLVVQSSMQLPRIAKGAFLFVACCDLPHNKCHSFEKVNENT